MSIGLGTGARQGPARPPARHRHGLLAEVVWALCIVEAGLVLVVLPWTLLWDNNYFFSLQPQQSGFWLGNHLRGAVSGLGLVTLWIGTGQMRHVLSSVFGGRRSSVRHRVDDVVDG